MSVSVKVTLVTELKMKGSFILLKAKTKENTRDEEL